MLLSELFLTFATVAWFVVVVKAVLNVEKATRAIMYHSKALNSLCIKTITCPSCNLHGQIYYSQSTRPAVVDVGYIFQLCTLIDMTVFQIAKC